MFLKFTQSSTWNRPWVSKFALDLKARKGKFGRICICSASTPEIEEFAGMAREINRRYANLHDYDFVTREVAITKRNPSWGKIKLINELLKLTNSSGQPLYQYIFWIDADAYFNRDDIRLESVIQERCDIMVCDDFRKNIMNCGTLIIKNTDFTRKFINAWWFAGQGTSLSKHHPWEQEVLKHLYRLNFFNLKEKCLISQAGFFNSNPRVLSCNRFKSGWNQTFIVHLMGCTNQNRSAIIRKKYKQLIQHDQNHRALANSTDVSD